MSRDAIRVVSLFCGAGFADYALHRASEEAGIPVEVVYACDSWPKAVEVYNANLPSKAVVADVKQLDRGDLPAHDLVIGGPPCQPHSTAGAKRGAADPRDCIPDFLRLADGSAYLMENVRSRLHERTPFSVRLCAADFGDVTLRRRTFYSDHVLHVIPSPSPRRFRDIRDESAPCCTVGMRSYPKPYTEIQDDGFLGSVTSHTCDQPLRGHGSETTLIPDDGFLGSVTASSFHGRAALKERAVRCPTILETQRAHSIPDSWDWASAGKGDRAKMIANGWPVGMGTAVLSAMLRAVSHTKERAA